MRKDKKQVIGDEIGDEQIKLFLDFEPVDATSPSLHKLIKAYRGLRIDDFERKHRVDVREMIVAESRQRNNVRCAF